VNCQVKPSVNIRELTKKCPKSYFWYFPFVQYRFYKICKLTSTQFDKHWNSILLCNSSAEVKERVQLYLYFPSGIQGIIEGEIKKKQAIQDTVLLTF